MPIDNTPNTYMYRHTQIYINNIQNVCDINSTFHKFANCLTRHLLFVSDGYTVLDVVMYWQDTPVMGVDEAELPQFTIIGYETNDRKVNV